ncbi:CGG triplet repeat-binding protein 1, partial [Aphis craccivora]
MQKNTLIHRLRSYVDEFGSNIFTIDSSILFCKICETKVNSDKKFNVFQHLKTDKHLKGINRCKEQTQRKQQQLMTVNISKKSSFNKDLCEALISANIPLNKLSNRKFKTFLETYTKHEILCEATLRKGYVDDIYTDTMNSIREKISNKTIWVSIDETTDIEGRYIANVIVGTLEEYCAGEIFLLNSDELDKANHSTICKLFDKSMNILWPGGIRHDNVLLFLSDAAPYMVKAGEVLKSFYTKMIHVTCAA